MQIPSIGFDETFQKSGLVTETKESIVVTSDTRISSPNPRRRPAFRQAGPTDAGAGFSWVGVVADPKV
jgi:hypothetical protein